MKLLDSKILEALAELICGDSGPYYRKGWELPLFFRSAGLNCPNHDGSTRKWWALSRLQEYNMDPLLIKKVLLRLADPKEYVSNPSMVNEVLPRLNKILSVEGLKVSISGVSPNIHEVNPTIPEPEPKYKSHAISIPDFEKLTMNTFLASILKNRWIEVNRCIESEAYLSAIVMMGSILEGVLLAVVTAHPKEANQATSAPKDSFGKVKRFPEWTLSNLIDVAHDCGWLQLDAKKFSKVLREYRNLVHPWEQMARKEVPDEDTCRICWEVVRAAINDIQAFKKS